MQNLALDIGALVHEEAISSPDVVQATLQYDRLPEDQSIRVLDLAPGSWNEPVRCSLRTVRLDDGDLCYEAISYAWGDPTDRKAIICEECVVSVTRNLFEALQRFRIVDSVRTLWADAICINQAASEERSSQVRLMNIIYQRASRVLAWLQHEEDDVVQADLNAIGRYLCGDWRPPEEVIYAWRGQDVAFTASKEGPHPDVSSIYDAMVRICSIPWFSRGWVIQEVVLSSSTYLFWGNAQIEFHLIGYAADEVITRSYPAINPHGRFTPVQRCRLISELCFHKESTGKDVSFLQLSMHTVHHQFSEPKDRIYGLLGLPTLECDPSTGETLIDPDYTITTMECLRNIARELLVKRNDMRLLSWIQHGLNMDEHWPTWVPKMSIYPGPTFATLSDRHKKAVHSAQISTEMCGAQECIGIVGFTVDVVDRDVKQYKEWGESRPDHEEVRHIQALLRQLETSYSELYLGCTFANPDRVRPLDTSCVDYLVLDYLKKEFGKTRGWDRGRNEDRIREFLDEYRWFIHWDPSRSINDDSPWEAKSEALYASSFHRRYLDGTTGHILFITREGMMGLGPEAMRPDDVVVVLHGAQVPFILRPAGGLWRLVGECYLYDFQRGKITRDWEERGSMTEKFCIY